VATAEGAGVLVVLPQALVAMAAILVAVVVAAARATA
jgi:hypothetical protein